MLWIIFYLNKADTFIAVVPITSMASGTMAPQKDVFCETEGGWENKEKRKIGIGNSDQGNRYW